MALPSKEALDLIGWLAKADKDALHTLVDLRGLTANDVSSLTTLAHALVGEATVKKALAHQPRENLAALSALTSTPEDSASHDWTPLASWGLVDASTTPPALLFPRKYLDPLKSLDFDLVAPEPDAHEVPSPESITSCARLVQSVLAQLGDIVDAMAKRAFAADKKGTLSANGLKALTDVIGSGYDAAGLVRLAHTAGLLTVGPHGMQATSQAIFWRTLTAEQQWEHIAKAWWAKLPDWIHQVVLTHPDLSWTADLPLLVSYHYPLLNQPDVVAAVIEQATLLGVLCQEVASPWGRHLVEPRDSIGLAEHFVLPVEGVYASEDFTLVASGPLRVDHRVVLDSLAHRELGGLVPRYRVTSRSILRALQAGVAPKDIVPTLQECALTSLPNGIVHLIEDTCRKAGEITLQASRNGTTLVITRSALTDELVLDPSLNALRLRQLDATTLVSPLPVERVNDFIMGSRYLALVEDTHQATGVPELIDLVEDQAYVKLHTAVDTLYEGIENAARHGVSPSLGSVLEVAIASKVPLEIRVEMPGGEVVSMVMEPRSVASGRLRGVELKNSMEKTIPVSSIRNAVPWSTPGS
jgi:hypothetical protein